MQPAVLQRVSQRGASRGQKRSAVCKFFSGIPEGTTARAEAIASLSGSLNLLTPVRGKSRPRLIPRKERLRQAGFENVCRVSRARARALSRPVETDQRRDPAAVHFLSDVEKKARKTRKNSSR